LRLLYVGLFDGSAGFQAGRICLVRRNSPRPKAAFLPARARVSRVFLVVLFTR
jgi:hypothetical protein